MLQRYRDKYCVYNDDVQGTAGITLAGMINATKLKGTKLKDEKYLFLGAGSAGIGLADLLCSALVQQGITLKEAQSRVYMYDVNGLLESTRTDLFDFQQPYAHKHAPTRDFVAAIESIKPTTIIGVSTIGGAFNQKVVETISRINERPVILALSNPTEHAECTAEQAYTWSKAKAIYAAGVQFAPVKYNGQTFLPGQANNFYIFPAVGMAIFATQAKRVPDEMFIEAGTAVADQVPSDLFNQGMLYPLQSNILETEIQTAARVAKLVFDSGWPGSNARRTSSISSATSLHAGLAISSVENTKSEGSMITTQTKKPKQRQTGLPSSAPKKNQSSKPKMDTTKSTNEEFRIETDSLGAVKVAADKLWGAQTQRSLEHFGIGLHLIPREMIAAYATLKKGAAIANHAGKRLDDEPFRLIVQTCDEILAGQHHDMFPLHVWMTGSGTQFNMNMNEVISNRCCQLAGTPIGSKTPVHPNDHVNMSQSSNDSFPSAMNIAAGVNIKEQLLPSVTALRDAIAAKAEEWKDVVKIGRTHMQDATPLTYGQEWSGYVVCSATISIASSMA